MNGKLSYLFNCSKLNMYKPWEKPCYSSIMLVISLTFFIGKSFPLFYWENVKEFI